ncbi:hypothetical protein TSHO111613_12560 [Tsukamurella hominis]
MFEIDGQSVACGHAGPKRPISEVADDSAVQTSREPHHVWTPGPEEATREARAMARLFLRSPAWIVIAVLCVLYAVVSTATGHGDVAHYAFAVVPVVIPVLIFALTWWRLRSVFVPGAQWTSTFGPESMTITSPLGRSDLLYSQMRRVRRRGVFVVIALRPAGRLTTYGALVPPPAEEFLRSRIGSER